MRERVRQGQINGEGKVNWLRKRFIKA